MLTGITAFFAAVLSFAFDPVSLIVVIVGLAVATWRAALVAGFTWGAIYSVVLSLAVWDEVSVSNILAAVLGQTAVVCAAHGLRRLGQLIPEGNS